MYVHVEYSDLFPLLSRGRRKGAGFSSKEEYGTENTVSRCAGKKAKVTAQSTVNQHVGQSGNFSWFRLEHPHESVVFVQHQVGRAQRSKDLLVLIQDVVSKPRPRLAVASKGSHTSPSRKDTTIHASQREEEGSQEHASLPPPLVYPPNR